MSDGIIGHYEIISFIGRGGMAAVYQAIDPEQNRAVAIKILGQEYQNDLGFRARFEREAETIARLNHPAIVPLLEFGQHESELYIVMEYMPGGSLADRILQGPLSIVDAADTLERVGAALDYAHNLGVIHRDLKPSNILFDQDNDAYLADFGIALHAANLTQDRVMISGTPAYMSPEQARKDKEIDGRSDLYSLGISLYESLTGKLPFERDTPIATLIKRAQELPPSPREINSELPSTLDPVFEKILSVDPGQRYQNGAAFTQAFYHACDIQPPIEEPSKISDDVTTDQRDQAEILPAGSLPAETLDMNSYLAPEAKVESEVNALATRARRKSLKSLGRRLSDEPVVLLLLVGLLGVLSAAVVVSLIRAPALRTSSRSDVDSNSESATGAQAEERTGINPIATAVGRAQKANAMLVYTDSAVTLINISASPLSVNDLLFRPVSGENDLEPIEPPGLWEELAERSGGTLSEGDCYQLLRLTNEPAVPSPEPILLPNCGSLQGWLAVDDEDWFLWQPDKSDEEFQVLQGDRIVQTCSLRENFCKFYLPQP